jgi:nitrogen regulatory protein P-II 1
MTILQGFMATLCSVDVRSREIGDGKIFVSNIEKIVRIRTGETDEEAI